MSATNEPERTKRFYVTADGERWLCLDAPHGLVGPPAIVLHQPLAGPVEFLHADMYNLPVPAEAKRL
jgi:hypothetical protein